VNVNGTVKLKLYKGNITCAGRESKLDSLFDPTISTFEDDGGAYDQYDAAGFIKLNALRLRIGANVKAKREAASKPAKKTASKKAPAKKAAVKTPVVSTKVAVKKTAAKKAAAK
jgi:argininosuccinate synthase